MGNLAVTHKTAVYPYIKTGIHTLEIQESLRRLFVLMIGKGTHILPAGIGQRNIRRVHGKRIAGIGILVSVIAVILPDAGHRHGIKAFGVKSLFIKFLFRIVNAVKVTEFPLS